MKNGCKRQICVNINCSNNPNFDQPSDTDDLTKKSMQVWKELVLDQKQKMSDVVCQ